MSNSHHAPRSRFETSPFLSWVRDYKVEIGGVVVAALGVFLLVERMNIRAALFGWLRNFLEATVSSLIRLGDSATNLLAQLTVSDLIGALLILGAVGALSWRVRWRLMRSVSLSTLRCPKCGGSLHRVHRRFLDRAISRFVPVRRYRCSNHECHWNGLRVGKSQPAVSRQSRSEAVRDL
jgi:hypothetical protein